MFRFADKVKAENRIFRRDLVEKFLTIRSCWKSVETNILFSPLSRFLTNYLSKNIAEGFVFTCKDDKCLFYDLDNSSNRVELSSPYFSYILYRIYGNVDASENDIEAVINEAYRVLASAVISFVENVSEKCLNDENCFTYYQGFLNAYNEIVPKFDRNMIDREVYNKVSLALKTFFKTFIYEIDLSQLSREKILEIIRKVNATPKTRMKITYRYEPYEIVMHVVRPNLVKLSLRHDNSYINAEIYYRVSYPESISEKKALLEIEIRDASDPELVSYFISNWKNILSRILKLVIQRIEKTGDEKILKAKVDTLETFIELFSKNEKFISSKY